MIVGALVCCHITAVSVSASVSVDMLRACAVSSEMSRARCIMEASAVSLRSLLMFPLFQAAYHSQETATLRIMISASRVVRQPVVMRRLVRLMTTALPGLLASTSCLCTPYRSGPCS